MFFLKNDRTVTLKKPRAAQENQDNCGVPRDINRKSYTVSLQGLAVWILNSGNLRPPKNFMATPGPTKLHTQHPEERVRRKSRKADCCLVAREGLHIELIRSRLNSAKTSLCFVNVAEVSQELKQRAKEDRR